MILLNKIFLIVRHVRFVSFVDGLSFRCSIILLIGSESEMLYSP